MADRPAKSKKPWRFRPTGAAKAAAVKRAAERKKIAALNRAIKAGVMPA